MCALASTGMVTGSKVGAVVARKDRILDVPVLEAQELLCFFFQAEDGIRDVAVTGVQTCALPISRGMTRVLVVDDEPGLRQSLGLLLTDAGFEVAAESDGRRALERATQEPFDIILCDVRMPQLDGLEFLRAYQKRDGGALVIMMSAYGGEEAALAAMKEGAYDYIPKPFRSDEVVLTLRKAEERERLGNTIATLRAQLGASPESRAVVAESAAMKAALDVVGRVAAHKSTVLITGESGTGKEVIAQAIHRASPRAAQLLVAINCAAIPEALLESELFGHVRGAFTGATADNAGLFEQADIAPLARHIAAQLARRMGRRVALTPAALAWLEAQPWPGNVRELQHAIERAAVLTDKEALEPGDLSPVAPLRTAEGGSGGEGTLREAVDAAERAAISAALGAVAGNRRAAAKRLGVSLRTLFYKMERYHLE